MTSFKGHVWCSACAAALLMGCTRVVYLETETPAGSLPPPGGSMGSMPLSPDARDGLELGVGWNRRGTIEESGGSHTEGKQLPHGEGVSRQVKAIKRFGTIYRKKGMPRIALFLNRELSDKVTEWTSDTRFVVSADDTEITREKKSERSVKTADSLLSIYTERRPSAIARQSPAERWMWTFENGFSQPFLSAGCRMVDRATIMRLTAVRERERGVRAEAGANEVEINALKTHADFLVEVLISRAPSSAFAYEFRATAKEVKTGTVVASVTSLGWGADEYITREVSTSSEGYKVAATSRIPAVGEVSEKLALDLMAALTRSWER